MLELALGLAVLAVIAGAVTPLAVRHVRQEAGHKTARELLAIADAGRAFYVANSRWPTDLDELRTTGHLPPTLVQSAFGTSYTTAVNGPQLEVTVAVPNDLAAGVTRLLPLSRTAGSGATRDVTAAVAIPGTTSDTSVLLHRQGTLVSSTMQGPLEVADQSASDGTNVRSLGPNSRNFFEGSVGIGTTSPSTKLDIHATNGAERLRLQNSDNSGRLSFTEQEIRMVRNFPTGASLSLVTEGQFDSGYGFIAFAPNTIEGMRITTSGRVGIGTASPSARLEVSGGDLKVSGGKLSGDGSGLTNVSLPALVYVAIPNNFHGYDSQACPPGYRFIGGEPVGNLYSTPDGHLASTGLFNPAANGYQNAYVDCTNSAGCVVQCMKAQN